MHRCQEIKEHVCDASKCTTNKQLLPPLLEHFSANWDPYHHTSINRLEKIQYRVAHFMLNNVWQIDPINNMITNLKWPSLQNRTIATLRDSQQNNYW